MTQRLQALFSVLGVVTVLALSGCSSAPIAHAPVQPAPSSPSAQPVNPWQGSDLSATLGLPPAAGGLAGYAFDAQYSQHLFFAGSPDNHIHEAWWGIDGWHTSDLTAATQAAAADPISLTAYASGATATQQVVYVAADDRHVRQLWWNAEGWHSEDLSAIADAPPATSTIVGYSVDSQLGEHVLYLREGDRHVQEMWWDGSTWHSQDLSAATGAPAGLEGALAAYVDEAQAIQHVIYVGFDSHLYELWCDTEGWHMTDLTTVTGTPGPIAGTVAAYMFDAQGTQHVFFVGVDHKIYELWSDPTGWQSSDLSAMTQAPTPAGNALTGYAFEAQGTQHVIYTGRDGHLYELWWDSGKWSVGNLTAGAKAPKPAKDRPVAYAFESQGTQHVVYRTADDSHLYEVWSGNPQG
jgi:Fungal fucose-specific lectin